MSNLAVLFIAVTNSARLDRNVTVFFSNNQYQIIPDKIDCDDTTLTAIACGYFQDTLNVTGWGILEIKTVNKQSKTNNVSDYNRMYAAGLLEGWLTPFEIYYQWINVLNERGPTYHPYMSQLQNWSTLQYQWIIKQISLHKLSSPLIYN